MKITEFNRLVTQREGKEESLNIAQVAEVMCVANRLLGGNLYHLINDMEAKDEKKNIT